MQTDTNDDREILARAVTQGVATLGQIGNRTAAKQAIERLQLHDTATTRAVALEHLAGEAREEAAAHLREATCLFNNARTTRQLTTDSAS